MKVLHIAESKKGGGAESVFRDTVDALKAYDKASVHLVACRAAFESKGEIDLYFGLCGKIPGLSSVYSIRNKKLLFEFLIKEKPELVHVQNYGNLSPSILSALLRYKRLFPLVKVIQTLHTFENSCSHHAAYDYRKQIRCLDCNTDKYKFKIFYRLCSRGGKIHSFAKGITSLIAIYYKKRVFDYYITPSRFLALTTANSSTDTPVKYINNPVPKVFFEPYGEVTVKDDVVVYFGRLSEEKNIGLLISAFAECIEINSGLRLQIIGDGPELERLEAKVKLLNIRQYVQFIPFLPQNMLRSFLIKAKVAVLPSKCYETASMLVFEAVGCRVVPIVGNYGGMKEMVGLLGIGETFIDGNIEDLSNKILTVIDNFEERSATFKDSFELVKQQSLDNYARNLLRFYSETCGFNH